MIRQWPSAGGGVGLDGGYADPNDLAPSPPGLGKKRLGDDQTWSDPLEHFAESWDETYKVSALTGREDPDDAEATVDIAIVPKGGGALMAQVPDGTSAGGNDRGANAVDWQTSRSGNTDVASGSGSVIGGGNANESTNLQSTVAGGNNNRASGARSSVGGGTNNIASGSGATVSGGNNNDATATDSAVGGGNGNTASQSNAVIAGGSSNNATGSASAVLGGATNTASGSNTTVGGGSQNTATANYSSSLGGRNNDATGLYSVVPGGYFGVARMHGEMAHASGRFSADGDAQHGWVVARNQTTDATQTDLALDGGTVPYRVTIPSDTAWMFTARIVARRTDADNESAGYEIQGVIDNNAGTTALVGTNTATYTNEDTAAWAVVAEADDTNDALVIKVTGEASKTIRWVASIHLVQVTG